MKMPERAPSLESLLQALKDNDIDLFKLAEVYEPEEEYLSYADTKYKPIPKGLKDIGADRNIWWLAILFSRKAKMKNLPLYANNSETFNYFLNEADFSFLHQFDLNGGSFFKTEGEIPSNSDNKGYLISTLIEESFSSSFIEGAISTREKAKKLISENREPKDNSERMILNNFKTMQSLASWTGEDLSVGLICKIHSSISEKTLDESKLGVFRGKDDDIVLSDYEGNIYHTPCNYTEIQRRIEELCSFINTPRNSSNNFIHPVIIAIILHFMLAYIHPFCDGNGRTARALFYWYLLKNDYWIVKYISISKVISESGNRYYGSFLNTETYDFDLNYFIKFQLEIFDRAIKAFHSYVEKKKNNLRNKEAYFPLLKDLNTRQKNIVLKVIDKPFLSFSITIEAYSISNSVSWETARKDLDSLMKRGILSRAKDGKVFVYSASLEFLSEVKTAGF